jgi:uncharacterized protein
MNAASGRCSSSGPGRLPDGCYADGNIVVIEQCLRATPANGNAYDNDYCFVVELENGLIRRVREYMDTATGNRMVFGAG